MQLSRAFSCRFYRRGALLDDVYGSVLERCEYDAYGNCSVLEPNFAPDPDGKSDYGNNYLFTGRRLDILNSGSLKIQYNRNRYYDYYTGRFITHDPLGINPGGGIDNPFGILWQYRESLNIYEYVKSNPVMRGDPSGLRCWIDEWGMIHCIPDRPSDPKDVTLIPPCPPCKPVISDPWTELDSEWAVRFGSVEIPLPGRGATGGVIIPKEFRRQLYPKLGPPGPDMPHLRKGGSCECDWLFKQSTRQKCCIKGTWRFVGKPIVDVIRRKTTPGFLEKYDKPAHLYGEVLPFRCDCRHRRPDFRPPEPPRIGPDPGRRWFWF